MKIKKIISHKYIRGTLLVLAGLLLGLVIFHRPSEEKKIGEQTAPEVKKTIWTCAMHPQIRMDHPGKCPICGMDLIPLTKSTPLINPDAVVMTEEGIKLAEVQTSIVSRQKPVKMIRLYGKIKADERLIKTQPAFVPGRIEKLLVNFTGEAVTRGEPIAQIYSPELVTAQKELLEALKMKEMQPRLLEAAREKLRQWKFTGSQIAEIENSGAAKTVFDVYATVSGIVISKSVNVGDYISQGAPLYEIADLSHVWAMFDAYETDLPWIRKGDRITFTLQSQPGKEFTGTVSFIDPVINPQTRVATVRVEIPNSGNRLKPDMFINGMLTSQLASSGNSLVIPQTSVLWTGTRSVVYVKLPDTKEPSYLMREITLGPSLGNSFVVLKGLAEGEEIVTNGTFSVDASAQLAGKPSMMNPEGGKTNTMPGMIMPGDTNGGNEQSKSAGVISGSDTLNKKAARTQEKMDISMDFKMQLNTVFDRYIVLKNAFFSSDEMKVKQAAKEVLQALDKTDMNLLKGDAMNRWMELLPNLESHLKQIASSDDLEAQRKTFSLFNDVYYKAIITFGLMGKTVYYQFCPMMNNNKGAYWLSETKDIRNPYYGKAMPTCGETRETLKY
jgi:membrane fusion protein, copper/silver efflux system